MGLLEVQAVICCEMLIDLINIINTSPFGVWGTGIGCGVDGDFKVVQVSILAWVDVCLDCSKDATPCFRRKNMFDCCCSFGIALFGVMKLATGEVILPVGDGFALCFGEGAFGGAEHCRGVGLR